MSDVGDVSKAITPIIENFAKLTGPLCEEVGLFFGEKVRAYRQTNLRKIVDGSVERLERAGKAVNSVPPRLLLPIIESASLEDNPTLQDMWIGLLAKASEDADDLSPSYAETLRVLTPNEAKALKVLYESLRNSPFLGPAATVHFFLMEGVCVEPDVSISPGLIVETLERLGLLRREYDLLPAVSSPFVFHKLDSEETALPGGMSYFEVSNAHRSMTTPFDDEKPQPEITYELAFTSYGTQFMRACLGPTSLDRYEGVVVEP